MHLQRALAALLDLHRPGDERCHGEHAELALQHCAPLLGSPGLSPAPPVVAVERTAVQRQAAVRVELRHHVTYLYLGAVGIVGLSPTLLYFLHILLFGLALCRLHLESQCAQVLLGPGCQVTWIALLRLDGLCLLLRRGRCHTAYIYAVVIGEPLQHLPHLFLGQRCVVVAHQRGL